MSLKDLIAIVQTDGSGWLVLVIIIISIIQITPIQVNPWSAIFGWFGKQFNKESDAKREQEIKELTSEINTIKSDISNLTDRLNSHIDNTEEREIANRRSRIIDTAGRMNRGQIFELEQVEFLMDECDKYEKYCYENHIANGVATCSIGTIRSYYEGLNKGEFHYGESKEK